MIKSLRIVSCFLIACWLSNPAFAAHDDLTFLTPESLPIETALSAPPAADSPEQTADMNQVLAYQARRTKADCTRAKYEEVVSVSRFFGPKYGPLTQDEVDNWSAFLTEVGNDADYFVIAMKKYWGRDRPFVTDSRVTPCIDVDDSKSYPSGHSTISRTIANVLSLIDPSRKKAFLDRANQIALDRVIGGVHYPTDIAAGKSLGDQVFAKLQESSDFQSALSQLKAAKLK